MNWTIGRRLTTGFAAVLTLTVAVGFFSVYRVMDIRNLSNAISSDSLPGVIRIDKAVAQNRANEATLLRHVFAPDAAKADFERQLTDGVGAVAAALKEYEGTITTEEDRRLYAAIAAPAADVAQARAEVLALSRAHKSEDALAAYQDKVTPAERRYAAALEAEVDYNRRESETRSAEIQAAVTSTVWIVAIGVAAATIGGGLVAWLITRATSRVLRGAVRQLTEGSQQVASASGQVATSAQSLSQGATEQAASLEETSASMEEMASMARKNSENTQEAASLITQVDQRVADSNQALTAMVSSMTAIQESSNKVANILKTIDEIAFQTNILALNAAVEAARAGEAGMGFAVVADEVRSLAQRSAQAAKDTAGLIEEAIGRSREGTSTVERMATSIGAITESVTRVKALVEDVREASRQQAQGIDQVSQAVSQMEKVTQTTAATAEESAAASEELNAQAEASIAIVGRLRALVDTGAQTPDAPVAPPAPQHGPKVVRLGRRAGVTAPRRDPEAELPLGDGTFGAF